MNNISFDTKTCNKAVLSQGEPRDAAINFDTQSNFTTESCGFPSAARLSCWSLSADYTVATEIAKNVDNLRRLNVLSLTSQYRAVATLRHMEALAS